MRNAMLWLALSATAVRGDAGPTPRPQEPAPSETPPAPNPEGPFVQGNPGQARAWARIQGKVALIAFYGRECAPCGELEAGALADPAVRALLVERAVAIRLQDERDSFYTLWRVLELPTLLFVTPNGEELGRIEGAPEAEAFLARAERILSETDGLASARARAEQEPEDPWPRLLVARALRKRNQVEAALAELLWVFDRTRGRADWRAQREGEVVREIGLLSQRMGQATLALRARRDEQAALLLGPPAEGAEPPSEAELVLSARDVRLLNATLGDLPATLAAWDSLRGRENAPRAAVDELFGADLAALLLQSRRYADVLGAWPDPIVIVERGIAEIQALRGRLDKDPQASGDPGLELNRLVTEASGYYEALLGVGRDEDAADLVELVLAFETNARVFSLLMLGAQRAGRLDQARALYERGLERLSTPAEREALQRVAQTALGRGQ